jgi:hypothetical protein
LAHRATVRVARILLARETRESTFFDAMKELWESERDLILFDRLKTLAAEPFATNLMKQHEIPELVRKKLLSCQLKEINRAKFIRIRTKLLSVKG